jgi:hypothetical protein
MLKYFLENFLQNSQLKKISGFRYFFHPCHPITYTKLLDNAIIMCFWSQKAKYYPHCCPTLCATINECLKQVVFLYYRYVKT